MQFGAGFDQWQIVGVMRNAQACADVGTVAVNLVFQAATAKIEQADDQHSQRRFVDQDAGAQNPIQSTQPAAHHQIDAQRAETDKALGWNCTLFCTGQIFTKRNSRKKTS